MQKDDGTLMRILRRNLQVLQRRHFHCPCPVCLFFQSSSQITDTLYDRRVLAVIRMRFKMLVRGVMVHPRTASFGRWEVRAEKQERGEEDEREEDGDDASEGGEAGNGA